MISKLYQINLSFLRHWIYFVPVFLLFSLTSYSQPTVSISSPSVTDTNTGPVFFVITYTGATTINLTSTDVLLSNTSTADAATITVTNGTTSTPTVELSGITGNGTIAISIAAGTSNDGTQDDLGAGPSETFNVDNIAPTVSISLPSVTDTNSGPVTFSITYTGASTINLTSSDVTLNKTSTADASTINVTNGSSSTPTVEISGISGDGTLGISIAAGTSSDDAGNTDTGAGPSTTFNVDNTAPTVAISAPSISDTNTGPVTYDITYTGANSVNLTAGDIILNKSGSADASTINITNGTTNNPTVELSGISGDGTLGISIAPGSSSDTAGNTDTGAGPSATFNVDNTGPTIAISTPSVTDTNTGPVTFNLTYTDASSVNLTSGDIILNKTASADATTINITNGTTSNPTVEITGISGDGTISISVAAGTSTDVLGNSDAGAGPSTAFNVDNTPPTVTISAPSSALTNTGPVSYTITYTGADVITLANGDITLNKTASADGSVNVTGTGTTTRTVTVSSIIGDGTLGISIAAATAADDAGNTAATAGPSTIFDVDNTPPTFISGVVSDGSKNQIVASFSDNITLSDETGFSVGGTSAGPILSVSGSGTSTLTFTLTGNVISSELVDLSYEISGDASDAAGNELSAFTNSPITNNVAPLVIFAEVKNSSSTELIVTFDASVTGTDAGFSVDGASPTININSVAGSGSTTFTFTLSRAVKDTDIITLSYNSSPGDVKNSTNIDLAGFSNYPITNNVAAFPEPTDHVTGFTATATSTTSLDLTWVEPVSGQLPENYLIVGVEALTGTFASVADGFPVANDNDWSDGNFAINVPYGTSMQTIGSLISGRNYIFKIYPYTNVLTSIDYKTDGTVPQDNASLAVGSATIISGGSGPGTVSSLIDTKAEAMAGAANFEFVIDDDGSTDGIDTAPTLIDQIVINRDAVNDGTGDWLDAIAGVILEDNGSGTLNSTDNAANFSIGSNSITISNIPNAVTSDLGYIADNSTKTYRLKIWLRTDIASTALIIDNKHLVFSIADTDISVETVTEPLSSTLTASAATSGSGNNNVSVIATELYYKFVGAVSAPHSNFTVHVQATDENKNLDTDLNGEVIMGTESSSDPGGYFESEGPNDMDEDLVAGEFIRTDMQVHKSGDYVINATKSGLAKALFGPFTVGAGDAQSDIVITSFNPADNIDYINFQESPIDGDGIGDIKVAEFLIRDGGTILPSTDSDNAETGLTDITFSLSNPANIREVALHNGTTIIDTQPGAATVTFADIISISAPDDGTKVFSLYISFNTLVTDNENFQLQITNAIATGSTFAFSDAADGNGGAASPLVETDDNRIEVSGTELRFVQQPTNVLLNATMTPAASIEATDANGSRDLDRDSESVSLISNGTLSGSPLSVVLADGFGVFPSIVHTDKGINLELTASLALHNPATSSQFDVTVSNETVLDATAFVPPSNILYKDFQETDINGDGVGDVKVGEFLISEGGLDLSDGDGVSTFLTSIEFGVTNFENIRSIALYDQFGTELGEQAGAASVNFGGFSYETPEGGTRLLQLFASYNSSVDDNEQSVFTITNVTTSSQSSDFAPIFAATPNSGDINRVEVIATKLEFTTQPPSEVLVSTNLTTTPIIEALDLNNNRDLDYDSPLSIVNTKSLGMSNSPTSISSGIELFAANFQYTDIGDGSAGNGTLTATPSAVAENGLVPTAVSSSPVLVRVAISTTISAGAAAEPATIQSTIDTAPGILVFDFTVTDDGGAEDDGTATLITEIIIRQLAGFNHADLGNWTEVIEGAILSDGVNSINGTIGATTITFSSIPSGGGLLGNVADNTNKTYALQIWLKAGIDANLNGGTGGLVDNKKLEFGVVETDITFETTGSAFLASESAASGDANMIDVDATDIDFTIEPPVSATVNTPYMVQVEARDINDNRDIDFNFGLDSDVTNQGGLAMLNAPTTVNTFSNGVFVFDPNFQFDEAGALPGGRLTLVANSITATSLDREVIASFDSYVTGDNSTLLNMINAIQFDANDITNNGTTDIKIGEFTLHDGKSPLNGGFDDVDGAITTLTDIDISITGYTNLKRVALYAEDIDGSGNGLGTFTEIDEQAAAATILFSNNAIGLFHAEDNNIRRFLVVASFQDSYLDNDLVQISLTAVQANLGGSQFNPAEPLPATDPAYNIVAVTATQLDWIAEPVALQGINIPVIPTPQVKANDLKGNLDLDFGQSVTVSRGLPAPGTTAGLSNPPTLFINGELNFPGFTYTQTGDGTLTATASGGLVSTTATVVDVIHTSVTTLDLGQPSTSNNNGISAEATLPAGAVDRAMLGFRVVADQTTTGEPQFDEFTIRFSNPIAGVFENIRLFRSVDPSYSISDDLDISASVLITPGTDFVTITSIGDGLTSDPTNRHYFLVVDINITADFSIPEITPSLVANGVPTGGDMVLSSGSVSANVNGRSYKFKDINAPLIEPSGLTPFNGDDNFPQTNLISIQFNESVIALDSVIYVYLEADGTLNSTLKLNPLLTSTDSTTFFFDPSTPVSGLPLTGDTEYYILMAAADQVNGIGFIDKSGNEFAGISSPNTWAFKTADNVAPFFTADLVPSVLPSDAVNIIDVGFDLRVSLDEEGKIFYIVVDPDVTTGIPLVDEIRNATFAGTIVSGTANILRGFEYNYVSIFDDNNFPTPSGGGGENFRVWITAEDFALPIPNQMVDGDVSHPGKAMVDGTFTSAPSGIIIQNTPLNEPVDVCIGDYQLIFAPINIVEGNDNDFNTGNGQSINFVLPAEFEYNTTDVTVTGQGGDISNVSFSFINNSVLTITYDIGSTSNRDKLIISGMKVKALGDAGTTGDITRLGGDGAVTAIPDGTVLVSLNTTQVVPVTFITDPNTNSIGNDIPEVLLIPDPTNPLSDDGINVFSGPGVFGETLFTGAAGLGTHTLYLTHTDEIGCVSVDSLQRTIFDSNQAITGLNKIYCTDEVIGIIPLDGKDPFFALVDLNVKVAPDQPEDALPNDPFLTAIFGSVTPSLEVSPFSGDYEFSPGYFHRQAYYDSLSINGGLIGDLIFTAVYQNLQDLTIYDTLEQRVQVHFAPTALITLNGEGPYGNNIFDASFVTPNTSINPTEYCEDSGNIDLTGNPGPSPGVSIGYFALASPDPFDVFVGDLTDTLGLADKNDGSAIFDPQELANSDFKFGMLEIKYIYENLLSSCNDTTYQTIRVNPKAVANFGTTLLCEDTPINFSDLSGYDAADSAFIVSPAGQAQRAILPQITQWQWKFNDDNSSAGNLDDVIITDPALKDSVFHKFIDPGIYSVDLTITNEFGCVSDTTIDLIIGGIPTAEFAFGGSSLQDAILFQSTSTVVSSSANLDHNVDSLIWSFGDNTILIDDDNDPLKNNDSTFAYSYSAAGMYNVQLTVFSTVGCSGSIDKKLIILENQVVDSLNIYSESFESGPGGWIANSGFDANNKLLPNNSWATGTPDPLVKNTIIAGPDQGNTIWITGLDTTYSRKERSFVFSPSFDLSDLTRPMISFDIFKQLDDQDGVIFEYSTDSLNVLDPSKLWNTLGQQINEGVNWFNGIGLAGNPGDDVSGLGWAGSTTDWVVAKHDLGIIPQPEKARVIFRFGLGTIDNNDTVRVDGFAFDNAFMGNRTRTVLLENFTSMAGGSTTGTQNQAIFELDSLPSGAELAVIDYHTSFDGEDILNMANASDPAARALYYGISENPRVAIDGKTDDLNRVFTSWGETYYSVRTLNISPFKIDIQIDKDSVLDGLLRIDARIKALRDIEGDFLVHVAIVEKVIDETDIPGATITTGETKFYNTLKKLLPDAGGTKYTGGILATDSIEISQVWNPTNLVNYSPGNIQVIIFVQDEITKEVYQTAIRNTAYNPVLGIFEASNNSDITLFPNPANNRVTLGIIKKVSKDLPIIIYNSIGQVIEYSQFNRGSSILQINTSGYQPGVYLIRFDHPQIGLVQRKFLVQHR